MAVLIILTVKLSLLLQITIHPTSLTHVPSWHHVFMFSECKVATLSFSAVQKKYNSVKPHFLIISPLEKGILFGRSAVQKNHYSVKPHF
jgi:hypothetical protein